MALRQRRTGLVLLLAALAGCADRQDPTAAIDGAPSFSSARGRAAIPDRYVVVLRDQVSDPGAVARDLVIPAGGRVHHVYEYALKGFAMTLPEQALNGIRNHPAVAYVAQDAMVYLERDADAGAVLGGTQLNATWGLDRSDQRDLPLDGTYTYGPAGSGVTVYVIDSGILPEHEEFGGRASIGIDLVGDGQNGVDCRGHGTHVAGTIGGSSYGVAKDVALVAVRVFGCSDGAPFSTIISAVDWVTANAQLPAVVNMSLGGEAFDAVDEAVRNSTQSGLVYVLSAGNDYGLDACMRSPARTAEALTVASATAGDARSAFSNVGPCVDLFAPGSAITSSWHESSTAIRTISGTSMAAPHVAGAAALYLEGDPGASPETVMNVITGTASSGRLADIGPGSPNLLLFTPFTAPVSGPVIAVHPAVLQLTLIAESDGALIAAGEAAGSVAGVDVRSAGLAASKDFRAAAGASPATAHAGSSTAIRPVRLSNPGNEPLNWTASPSAAWIDVSPASGSLAAFDTTTLIVTIDATALAVGVHNGMIEIADPAAANSPRRVDVALSVVSPVDLESGTPVSGLSGASGSQQLYRIQVPAGAGALVVETFGGTGDLDLFVRYSAVPEPMQGLWDCLSAGFTNDESCTIMSPPAGDWYIVLYGWSDYDGAGLVATVADAVAIMEVWPTDLHFHHLLDESTGAVIASSTQPTKRDRETLEAAWTLTGGKSYPGTGSAGASPATVLPSQFIGVFNTGTAPLNWTASASQPWLDVAPGSGVLDPWAGADLMATVDATGLTLGEHFADITIDDPAALNSPRTVNVTVSVGTATRLDLGVPLGPVSGAGGSFQYYRVSVPAGLPALNISTSGGIGDVDMFVRQGSPPDLFQGMFDCVSASGSNDEQCRIQNPAAGDWYILLYGFAPYQDVTLLAAEGQPAGIIELWPSFLFFQQLTDPGTGALIAAAPPSGKRTREQLQAARTTADGRAYAAVTLTGATPASFFTEQPVWLGNTGSAALEWSIATDQSWLTVSPSAGVLEPGNVAELGAAVNASGLTPGYHSGTLLVTDPNALNSPQMVWVDLSVSMLTLLDLRVPRDNLAGDWSTGPQYFRVTVPEGATDLQIRTSGGTGNLDMFVRHGSPPDLYWWEFDCVSWEIGTDESCTFETPAAGDWYILVYPLEPFAGVTLLATVAWTMEALITDVDRLVAAGAIAASFAHPLRTTLEAAMAARDRGDPGAARALLAAFIREVEGLRGGGRISADTAESLLEAAAALLEQLGG